MKAIMELTSACLYEAREKMDAAIHCGQLYYWELWIHWHFTMLPMCCIC